MMRATRKTAVYLAGGIILPVAVAVLAWRAHPVPAIGDAPPSTPLPRVVVSAVDAAPGSHPARLTADVAAGGDIVIPPLPANATHVPDEDLLKLSAMVNLANAQEEHIDKDRWGRAVPIAERLTQGPCDCEQRNWLNHFVAMGHDALTNSEEAYHRAADIMRTMARNDQQLADQPATYAH